MCCYESALLGARNVEILCIYVSFIRRTATNSIDSSLYITLAIGSKSNGLTDVLSLVLNATIFYRSHICRPSPLLVEFPVLVEFAVKVRQG